MKRLKSYFFTNSNLNSRGKYISLKDNAEPNETLFNDLLDSVVKPKVGADYQDQADFNAVNTKDSSKFVTAENLPEVDSSGSLLTITTTAAVDTNLLRRKKYTVSANIPSSISDISSRLTTKLVTPANLPKFALDNSEYNQVASQLPYFAPSVVVTTDGVDFYQTYSLKLRALESTMMTHAGVRLDTILNELRTDVNACVSDSELTSAVNSLNLAINNKATKVSPNFVAGYNGTKVTVNSQGIVTTVTKASASDITNDSSVSGSTVKDALNWLKANGGGVGGASDTDGVTNLSDVPGGTATDALNNLLESLSHYFVKDVVSKSNGDTLEVDKINVLTLSSDTSFTLPTPSLAYKGKVLIIVQGNGGVNRAEIFGGLQGSVIISDLSDVLIYNCVYDIGGGGNWVLISRDDSKMCQIPVIVESSTHYASANENIKADALSFGANQSVVIPASNSEGRMIYVYYPTGAPTAFVVNLTGGYTATLNQGDWFLLRDNGSFWEAIGTSQNTVDLSPYATIDSPTFTGIPAGPTASPGTNTTQLATTAFVTTALSSFVGGATYQSTWNASTNTPTLASGVGTKGYYYVVSVDGSTNLDGVTDWKVGDWAIYNGTAWQKVDNTDAISSFNGSLGAIVYTPTGTANRVTITGASGLTPTFDIASTYAGQTSITTLGTIGTGTWQGTAIADAYIASAATWNGKFNTPTGLTTNNLLTWNGTSLASVSGMQLSSLWGQLFGFQGTAGSNGRIFSVLDVAGGVELLTIRNDGTLVNMHSTKHQFGTTGNGVVIINKNLEFNNLIFAQATSTSASQYMIGLINTAQSIYGFRYSNDLIAYWQSKDTTGSTVISRWADGANTQVALLQNNGLVLGTSTINSACTLDLQSTTKGLGLPSVPTSAGLAATRVGNLRYNPTTVVPEYSDGSRWVKLPKFYTQVATQTIANRTDEVSMFNDTGALGTRTIPGSSTQVGSYFRIRLDGYFSSTAGPFITVKIKMGSVVIFDTTLTATFSPGSPQQWFVEAYFTVQSVGSGTSATVFGQGRFCYATSPSTQYNVLFTTNTTVSSGYDSTASQVLDVTFTWNTANVANTITTTNAVIEQIN